MPDEASIQRGQRLKRVAKAAGYTSDQIGEQIGKEGGTVRGYWRGYSDPDVDTLVRYARACHVSVEYLATGEEKPMGPSGTMMEWLLRVRALTEKGLSPAEAIDQITGPRPTDVIAGWDLTPEERELLEGSPDEVNATLDPRSRDLPLLLEQLTPEDEQMVRQLIARLTAKARAAGEERG